MEIPIISIPKTPAKILLDSCDFTGMTCKKCTRKFVSFVEVIEDDILTEIDVYCSNCMTTFFKFLVINDLPK